MNFKAVLSRHNKSRNKLNNNNLIEPIQYKTIIFTVVLIIFVIINYYLGINNNFNFKHDKSNNNPENKFTLLESVYYTLITNLTIGYGDIVPKTKLAKLFCILQIYIFFYLLVN